MKRTRTVKIKMLLKEAKTFQAANLLETIVLEKSVKKKKRKMLKMTINFMKVIIRWMLKLKLKCII